MIGKGELDSKIRVSRRAKSFSLKPSPVMGRCYGAYLALQRSVTADGYKLIVYPKISKARLYHVKEDPQEQQYLADDPAQQPRMKQLFAKLLDLQQQMGDLLDLTQTFPELAAE